MNNEKSSLFALILYLTATAFAVIGVAQIISGKNCDMAVVKTMLCILCAKQYDK